MEGRKMIEVWKDIKNFPNYQVSNYGKNEWYKVGSMVGFA